MRLCSFSSSVFARLRGGRLVLGSGRTWPQDFRFLTGFEALLSGAGVCEGSDDLEAEREGEGEFSIISILIVVGIMVSTCCCCCCGVMAGVFIVWEKREESKMCSAIVSMVLGGEKWA